MPCAQSAAAAAVVVAAAAIIVAATSAAVISAAEDYDDEDDEPEAVIVATVAEHSKTLSPHLKLSFTAALCGGQQKIFCSVYFHFSIRKAARDSCRLSGGIQGISPRHGAAVSASLVP